MTRFVTKTVVAVCAALPVLAPVTASARTAAGVDERTGPVSFANAASVRLGADAQHGGALITETQRSPVSPGRSKLGEDRVSVPKNDGERASFGGNYEIDLGPYGSGAPSPYPAGIASRDHDVVAELQATDVPRAVAETNYALRDHARGGAGPVDDTVLVLEGARSAVDCAAPRKLTGTTSVTRLWVRGDGDALRPVAVPEGSATLRVSNLRMGAPGSVPQASRDTTVSDLEVSRVSAFDQLIKQDGWRAGDVTAVAGWRVRITTHVHDAADVQLQDVPTTIVLGGVSCSIPKDFVARPAGGTSGGAKVNQPPVPTEVPAGYLAPAPAPPSGRRVPIGLGLLGGGLVFGALAIGLGRRRVARGE
ncbi:hypothetical protein [Amycolatopsis sp. PS_44_ISF1]|uniref:hypothetical protein n=1 Tax=Amycolatopsis sp. PS_44_ISF1 TaxID=2974917 RepID=UPI0028DF0DDD|nr:hypothetical protein [Amycolatopsis sp. PS_44_ISF1]MDT8914637.1 hypothetical protein [Amycolatopsis sp. PS_44_ISF1]